VLFSSPLYAAFLIPTWIAFWALRRAPTVRVLFLVCASYFFYWFGTWDAARVEAVPIAPAGWAFLCLAVIFVGSSLDFFVCQALGRTENPRARNALLLASIVYYLGVLSIFKYLAFAADSIAALLGWIGVHVPPTHLRMVLPFGISFFTFETMSYTIDVWRRRIAPTRRYLDYLLFVCFFPHLVAGPIVRPGQMLPQLAAPPRYDADRQARGLLRIATGLFKKILIGDYLAQAVVERVFSTPERFTALEVLLAVYAYAAEIYADFSGYTDIAIGTAALFGYELPENFDAPYLATSLQDFWRRWHISLSTWLRDYLYKPLGGSRHGAAVTYRNLMLTMVLGGLWHGASWNFVIWGALHGCALAVTRMWQRSRPPLTGYAARVVTTLATFHFVCLGWIFFRAPTLSHAGLALETLTRGTWRMDHVSWRVGVVVAVAMILHALPRAWKARGREAFVGSPAIVQGLALAVAAILLHVAARAKPEPFVYGQF
jgi:D-alanyl-lipoteichoic acid acyltransferase DltB (MBOAT superfamily)